MALSRSFESGMVGDLRRYTRETSVASAAIRASNLLFTARMGRCRIVLSLHVPRLAPALGLVLGLTANGCRDQPGPSGPARVSEGPVVPELPAPPPPAAPRPDA